MGKHKSKNSLKAHRMGNGMTQEEVAYYLGITVQAYQRYEYGKVDPRVSTAVRIAKILKCPVEDLWR